MGIGTRVMHRRYSWMVGYVTGSTTLGVRTVAWDSDRYWNAEPQEEYETDLRPTPHQPIRVHHGDGDEALPVI